MDLHFASAWERVSDAVPDADAVVMGDHHVSYAEFDDQAARFASAIEAAGLAPGAKVGIYLYNCPEYLIAQYGASKHECCPINVNFRYLDDELIYLLDNSDSEVLVFHSSLGDRVSRVMDQLPRVRAWVEVRDEGPATPGSVTFDDFLGGHEPQPRRDRDPADHYMLYTGGTTGMPKGVIYENHGKVASLYSNFSSAPLPFPESLDMVGPFATFMHDNAKIVSVPCCPLMHGTGMWVGAMPALLTGGTVVLLEQRGFSADELLDAIERHEVTRPVIVGDAFARPLARAIEVRDAAGTLPDLSTVNAIVSSGAMWSAEVKQALSKYLDAVLLDALGSSEGGAYGSVESNKEGGASTARFTLSDDTLVVSEDDEQLEPNSGATGLLASRTAARGYYKDPEKTAKTFKEFNGEWYVITGDWATLEADGSITLHGRGSNCINSGGEKIFPEEVEEAIKTHPAIEDCYVVGMPDERFGSRVVAIAGSASDVKPDQEEIRLHLRGQISGYKIPREVYIVEAVQRAPNGKADYDWAKHIATEQLQP